MGLKFLLAAAALSAGLARAGDLAGPVSLETRWWNEHEFGWRLAEAAGLRWAITDGISARGRVGGESVPAAQLAADFEKQTGIRAELIGGLLVLHRPNDAKRKELEARLAAGGGEAVRAAWLLGWLKDARAWPALAKAAAGKDPAVALSAAVAMRRLDGEEDFNLSRWIAGPTPHEKKVPDGGLSQLPLGACFENAVSAADLDALAKSPWVPLREAATRLAPGCGDRGRSITEASVKDPSFLVRQSAARALRKWQMAPADVKVPAPPFQKPDLAKHWELFHAKGENGAISSGAWLAAYGSDTDIRKLVEVQSNPPDDHVRTATLEVLIYNSGGLVATEAFRKHASSRSPFGRYGLAMLFDGEALTKELGPLLGNDNWSLSSELLLARFAGPSALPELEKAFSKRPHVAPLAVGFIGGPESVRMITPLLDGESLDAAVAAARGLGEGGQQAAVAPLVKALANPNRVVRSRAALALGRIGGPEAAAALAALLKTEKEHLPKQSALAMLREIKEEAHSKIVASAEQELAGHVPTFNPVRPELGVDLPTGKWVPLSRVHTVASVGETRGSLDPYAGIWLRYGGCSPAYSSECVGFDVASGKWFVVRPPETLGLFYNEVRAASGCSRGITFEPRGRLFWINATVGSGRFPYNGNLAAIRNKFSSYDVALDRFVGYADGLGGEMALVADTKRGLICPLTQDTTTRTFDTTSGRVEPFKYSDSPKLANRYPPDPMAYDPVNDVILRGYQAKEKHKDPPETSGVWIFDQGKGAARKSKSAAPAAPYDTNSMAMGYDSLNRAVIWFAVNGAWLYDREKDQWERIAEGDCSAYVTVGFDPQHNVFLTIKSHQLHAFRYKNVPAGTKAFFGDGK